MDIQRPNQNNPSNKENNKSTETGSDGFSHPAKEEGSGVLSFFVELVKVILLALVIIVPIRTFIFQPFFVQGASMEPNFHNGEYLIINELGYKKTVVAAGEKELFSVDSFKDLKRGDPVVFRYPGNPKQFFIKRVIGLPEERISLKNGTITIFNKENPKGIVLDESDYLPTFAQTDGNNEYVLKKNEYFVLGDNRSHSSDSRTWGTLPADMIVGKVLLRAWPFGEFKIF